MSSVMVKLPETKFHVVVRQNPKDEEQKGPFDQRNILQAYLWRRRSEELAW